MDEKLICGLCSGRYPASRNAVADSVNLCPECAATQTVICRCCGNLILRSNAVDGDLCECCYEEDYVKSVLLRLLYERAAADNIRRR